MLDAVAAVPPAVDLLRLLVGVQDPVVRLVPDRVNADLEALWHRQRRPALQLFIGHLGQASLVGLVGERLEQESRCPMPSVPSMKPFR